MDKTQLDIWQSLFDRYSYGEYLAVCKKLNVEPLNVLEFGRMTGVAGVATVMHYKDNLYDAVNKILALEINETPRHVAEAAEYSQVQMVQTVQQVVKTPHGGAVLVDISRGLGDTVAKITHATKLDKLAEIYTHLTGKDCGCASRQEALNKLFPYGIKEQ